MADNVTLDPGSGGSTVRTKDRTGVETEIVALDLNPAGAEQLMATAALADGTSNPTTAPWAGMLMCFNGTTWDRIRGDTTNGIFVNVKAQAAPSSLPLPAGAATAAKQPALGTAGSASTDVLTIQGIASGTVVPVSGTVTATGPLTDTQLRATPVPVSGTVTANLGTAAVTNAGTFAVQDSQVLTDDAAFTVGTTKVRPAGFLADQTSTDSVDEGDIGAARMTLDRKQIFTLAPSADTEGLTVANNIDVDETEDAVKASAGKLYGWFWYNDGASEVYIKYYNDTVANVVVGTTTPFMTIPIPAGSASNIEFSHGISFSAAITVAATTAAGTADTGAPATNQVVGFSVYQ